MVLAGSVTGESGEEFTSIEQMGTNWSTFAADSVMMFELKAKNYKQGDWHKEQRIMGGMPT